MNGFARDFAVCLLDGSVPDTPEARSINRYLAQVRIQPGASATVSLYPNDRGRPPSITRVPLAGVADPDQPYTVRLVHYAGREEIWLNKQRLLYLPNPRRPNRVGFSLIGVGSSNKLKVQFNALSADAPPAVLPAGTPKPE